MKHWMIGSVAAVALLAACGGNDNEVNETGGGGTSAEVAVTDIDLPGLTLRAGDPNEAGAALEALYLDASGAGRVGFADSSLNGADAVFSDVTITVEDGELPLRAGSMTFKGLEMTDDGASFSQMVMTDVTLTPDEDEGTLEIANLHLTNPSPALAAWVASLMGEGEPADFPSFEQLSFDGLGLDGLQVDPEQVDELDVFKIGAIDIRDFSNTGLGSMVFEGLQVSGTDDGAPMNISLGAMKVSGISETIMQLLGAVVSDEASDGDTDEAFASVLTSLASKPGDPGYDTLLVDAFAVDVGGVDFDLPKMELFVTRDDEGRPTRSVTRPFSMTLKADPEGEYGSQLAGPLAMMGYEQLNLSGAGDVRIDPDADTMTSVGADNYLALEDGFRLSGGGSFSGLKAYYEAIAAAGLNGSDDPSDALAAMSNLTLNNMELTFVDDSIVEKAFALASAMTGQEESAIRAQATGTVGFLPVIAGQAGVDVELAQELSAALSSFLTGSNTLSLKLDPDTPINGASLEDPSSLTRDRLGFSASAK